MKLYIIAIFLFALVGMVATGNIFHELSHKSDFHKYVTDEEICFLEFDTEAGSMAHYSFTYDGKNPEPIERISEYTEKKAVIANIIVALLFLMAYFNYIDDYFGVKNER